MVNFQNTKSSRIMASLTVTPAALSVVADDQNRVYGQANPNLTGTITGLQNGDSITAGFATLADASTPIGTYEITSTLTDPDTKGWAIIWSRLIITARCP